MARWARGSGIVRAGELGNVPEADCRRIERSAEFQQFLAVQKAEAERLGELSAKEMRELANEEIDSIYRAELVKAFDSEYLDSDEDAPILRDLAAYLGYANYRALYDAIYWSERLTSFDEPLTSWDKRNFETVLAITRGEIERREKRREEQRKRDSEAATAALRHFQQDYDSFAHDRLERAKAGVREFIAWDPAYETDPLDDLGYIAQQKAEREAIHQAAPAVGGSKVFMEIMALGELQQAHALVQERTQRSARSAAQPSAQPAPRSSASRADRSAPAQRYKTRTSWGQRVGMFFGYAFYAALVVVGVGVVGIIAAIVISSFT